MNIETEEDVTKLSNLFYQYEKSPQKTALSEFVFILALFIILEIFFYAVSVRGFVYGVTSHEVRLEVLDEPLNYLVVIIVALDHKMDAQYKNRTNRPYTTKSLKQEVMIIGFS